MKLAEAEGVFIGAMAVMAGVGAYFGSPLMPYAHAGALASIGLCLGAGAAGSWLGLRYRFSRRWQLGCQLLASMGFVGVVWQLFAAEATYSANLRRCAQLQADMLSATPKRSDGPEIFAALGCRVQGSQLVSFPLAPTASVPKLKTTAPSKASS